MHYIEFISTLPYQKDTSLQTLIEMVKSDPAFPSDTSDPQQLAKYMYLKLDHKMTSAFQKTLIIYAQNPENRLPDSLRASYPLMLDSLNIIIDMQNNDNNYPWR